MEQLCKKATSKLLSGRDGCRCHFKQDDAVLNSLPSEESDSFCSAALLLLLLAEEEGTCCSVSSSSSESTLPS